MPAAALSAVGVSVSSISGCLHTAKTIASVIVCGGDKAIADLPWQNVRMAENYIRAYREQAKLTLQALGDKLDPPASAGTMSAYESGSREVSLVRLRQIAAALGTTPGSLLDGPPGDEVKVPAEVIKMWDRIPTDQRDQAKDVLAVFAKEV